MSAESHALADVSRETSEKLSAYAALVRKWNPAINLVGRSTLAELEGRHIADSAQLFDLMPPDTGTWVDLGSGAGFPGLVVAILAEEKAPGLRVTLIESDRRKATFLRTVIRELCLKNVAVLAERIEDAPPQRADVLSARALAPLSQLFDFAKRHLSPCGIALFPKGARYREELETALASWHFDVQEKPSSTDPDAVILKFGGIARV